MVNIKSLTRHQEEYTVTKCLSFYKSTQHDRSVERQRGEMSNADLEIDNSLIHTAAAKREG